MEELPFIHLNEEDFRLAIFEQLNGPIDRFHSDVIRLQSQKSDVFSSLTISSIRRYVYAHVCKFSSEKEELL